MQKHRELLESLTCKPSYKKGHIEKDFQADISKQLRSKGWIAYHIKDVGMWTKFLDGIHISPEGDTVYIEFKKVDGYTFNVSQFEPSQIQLLSELSRRPNCEAYIMVYSQKTGEFVVKTFEDIWEGRNSTGGVALFKRKLI